MPEEKAIREILSDIADKMCDNYCKWPEYYEANGLDEEIMFEKNCAECPMMRL